MLRSFLKLGLKQNLRGFGFLTKLLLQNGLIEVKTVYNSRFLLNPYEKIDTAILRTGYFDTDVFEALEKELTDNDVLWDIGANFGLHSITLKLRHPNLKICAFEPLPKTIELFFKNCSINNVEIPLFPIAIDEKRRVAELYTAQNNLGATSIHRDNSKGSAKIGGFKVFTETIDNLISHYDLEAPTILKIDAEGNEFSILNGAKKLLNSGFCRVIVFEANKDIEKITSFLDSLKYHVRRLSNAPNYVATLR